MVATGSRTSVVPFLNGAGSRLVANDEVFDWEDLPESVAVFGPGVIGLEIGQALSRLGVCVAEMLEMPFYHPVIEEGLRTALRDLHDKLKLGPESSDECLDCSPGA